MEVPQRSARRVIRFGVFEVDLHAGELRKQGIKIKLQQQPFRVLALLLEQAGEVVTREDLRQAIWPAGTFVEFDLGLDAAIHKLRSALGDSAENPRFVETSPRRGYRFIAAVDGVVASDAARRAVPMPKRRRLVWAGGLAVLVVATALGALRLGRGRPGSRAMAAATEPSIAVLPLATHGTDASDAALADGMTEELIAMLGKLGRLRVIASTSSFAFKGRAIDVRRIADSLRVSHILEGSLQKIGSRLRLQVRLVEARDGSTRWSEVYDREMQDLFATEDDIASAVARELAVRLAGRTGTTLLRHRTRSIAAYELYLRGSDLTLLRTDSGVRAGVEYFSRAIAIDSMYAAAYAGLAHMYGVLGFTGDPGLPLRELYARVEGAARKAVALDDSLPEAHVALAFQDELLSDLASAETELTRALALDPAQPRVHEYLARLFMMMGRPADALAEARHGLEADPLSPTANAELARAFYNNGRCDEALAQLQSLAGVRPPVRRAVYTTGLCFAEKRRWPEAIATLRQGAVTGGLHTRTLLGFVLARSGQRDEARQFLADLRARQQRGGNVALDVAIVYAGLGDSDRVFTWLSRAVDDTWLGVNPLRIEIMGPTFQELRRDPRFERLSQRLRLQRR